MSKDLLDILFKATIALLNANFLGNNKKTIFWDKNIKR